MLSLLSCSYILSSSFVVLPVCVKIISSLLEKQDQYACLVQSFHWLLGSCTVCVCSLTCAPMSIQFRIRHVYIKMFSVVIIFDLQGFWLGCLLNSRVIQSHLSWKHTRLLKSLWRMWRKRKMFRLLLCGISLCGAKQQKFFNTLCSQSPSLFNLPFYICFHSLPG